MVLWLAGDVISTFHCSQFVATAGGRGTPTRAYAGKRQTCEGHGMLRSNRCSGSSQGNKTTAAELLLTPNSLFVPYSTWVQFVTSLKYRLLLLPRKVSNDMCTQSAVSSRLLLLGFNDSGDPLRLGLRRRGQFAGIIKWVVDLGMAVVGVAGVVMGLSGAGIDIGDVRVLKWVRMR